LEIAGTPSDQLAREYLDPREADQWFHLRKSAVISRYLVYMTRIDIDLISSRFRGS